MSQSSVPNPRKKCEDISIFYENMAENVTKSVSSVTQFRVTNTYIII